MDSITCGARKRLLALHLINEHIMQSLLPLDEVKFSLHILNEQLKTDIKCITTEKIIRAIEDNNFSRDTEAYQAAIEIFMLVGDGQKLFTEVFDEVFTETADEDSFEKIIRLLDNFEYVGPIIYAYCSLFNYIDRLMEQLFAFRCAVGRLLERPNLDKIEEAKLNDLMQGIKRNSDEYLRYNVACAQLTDLDF